MPRKDYAPKPIEGRRMNDDQMARAKDRQKLFSYTTSGLGLGGLGLLGGSVAAAKLKKNPLKAAKMKEASRNTAVAGGGIGALAGINFARIQGEESKRAREIKKSNYGAGYSQFYSDKPKKEPFRISSKAHDPERSRERRAAVYPYAMGAGAVGTGGLTVREAMKKKPKTKATEKTEVKVKPRHAPPTTKAAEKTKKFPLKDIDTKILRSKTARVGAGSAATAGLAYGAYYNAQKKNRRSYEDGWYRG